MGGREGFCVEAAGLLAVALVAAGWVGGWVWDVGGGLWGVQTE